MGSKRKIVLTCLVVAAALLLSVGTAYARYREEIVQNLNFQVRPMESLNLSNQTWTEGEDGSYVLTFTMTEAVEDCRIYLAVSTGVTQPDKLTVTLQLPQDPNATEPSESTEATTLPTDPITGETVAVEVPFDGLIATAEEIPSISALSALFGSGYVYRFLDGEAEDEIREEIIFDLAAGEYVLTVSGLEDAANTTSLLRLFIEYAQ